ncbi:MAG: peptide chain release factor N(5)-glutamine methyltransferase [Candidatus Protistobacter heckmanni]|nr:peptide chain release factor N(5)-glutamine methyltransferase [Candidatus Protistobacter heckmanni]
MSPDDLLRQSGLPMHEARLLLGHATGLSRAALITRDALPEAQEAAFLALAARRRAGEPVAYLTGRREFHGLDFEVNPAVFIPRPETELLVELALEKIAGLRAPAVLDLGTGSGAIAVAIAHARPDARVCASDASEAALQTARANAARLLGDRSGEAASPAPLEFFLGDWYAALPGTRRFDLIVSNPPYIADGDPHLSQGDLRFEPVSALTDGVPGARGLADLRAIAAGAASRLNPGGWLLVEHGYDQAEGVAGLLGEAGLEALFSAQDLAGIPRVGGGRKG